MKIGFIAMSGIRALDPELLALGLTLPGFVERSKTIASLPSLGLLTLAGMTPNEHEIHYIEIEDIREVDELEPFDLVAISSFSAQIQEGYDLAARYRQLGVPVVMGGLHVTTRPDEPGRRGVPVHGRVRAAMLTRVPRPVRLPECAELVSRGRRPCARRKSTSMPMPIPGSIPVTPRQRTAPTRPCKYPR